MFVVVVGATYQIAQSRADERWASVVMHMDEGWQRSDVLGHGARLVLVIPPPVDSSTPAFFGQATPIRSSVSTPVYFRTRTRGGNIFRELRQTQWKSSSATISLRQARCLFGSHIEAHMLRGRPEQIEAARAILAAVDIELIVEP